MEWKGMEWDGLDFIRPIPPLIVKILMVECLNQTLDLKINSVFVFCVFKNLNQGSWSTVS